jgi:hypothetical protein
MATMTVDHDPWVAMAREATPEEQAAEAAYWAAEDARHDAAEHAIGVGLAEMMMASEEWQAFREAHRELAHWQARHAEAMATATTYADDREVGRLHDAVVGANRRVKAALAELEAAYPDIDVVDHIEMAVAA